MCDIDFDGSPDFWSKTHPKARKPHTCIVCRSAINPGRRYLRESYKWEGTPASDACCLRCEKDRDRFGEAHGRQFPFASSFVDFLIDCLDERDDESERVWRPMLRRIQARKAKAA